MKKIINKHDSISADEVTINTFIVFKFSYSKRRLGILIPTEYYGDGENNPSRKANNCQYFARCIDDGFAYGNGFDFHKQNGKTTGTLSEWLDNFEGANFEFYVMDALSEVLDFINNNYHG